MIYFDTTLLVRLYLDESGFERVREIANSEEVLYSSALARAETVAAMHRHLREKKISLQVFREACGQFQRDQDDNLYSWLALIQWNHGDRLSLFLGSACPCFSSHRRRHPSRHRFGSWL